MWQGGVFVLFCFLLFLHTRLQNKSGEKLDDLSAVCTPCANRVQRYPGGRGGSCAAGFKCQVCRDRVCWLAEC